uniref:Putative secreted protein n=1 Tax=Anopheles darlingi TaxID=43151 RepID=A0A2M4D499_ANODA
MVGSLMRATIMRRLLLCRALCSARMTGIIKGIIHPSNGHADNIHSRFWLWKSDLHKCTLWHHQTIPQTPKGMTGLP